MLTRRRGLSHLAATFGLLMLVAACGGGGNDQEGGIFAACDSKPNSCNSAKVEDGGTLRFAIGKNIPNWNINSAEGNLFEASLVMAGVLPQVFVPQPDTSVALNKSLMVSVEQVSDDPQTIVYKIRKDAVWSDGTPITAKDFRFLWKTMNGEDCPQCEPSSTGGYEQITSVEGSDNGKTVTVTLEPSYADWKSLFGGGNVYIYPAHIAARHGDLSTPEGLKKAWDYFAEHVPTFSGGPFKIKKFQNNVAITEVPNPKWWGEGPHLDRLIWRVVTDAAQLPTALANHEVDAIYPQPQLDLVQQVEQIPDVSYQISFGLNWEHFDLNLANEFLAAEPLRDALFTAIDRKKIIDKTVGQFTDKAKPLNSHIFVPQQKEYKDVVSATGHGSGNLKKAKRILTEAGYTIEGSGSSTQLVTPEGEPVPPLRIRYTAGNAIRKNECQLLAKQVAPLGIDIKVSPTNDLGGTLADGDYDIIVFAWIVSPFDVDGALQQWHSGSPSNFGDYSSDKADKLLERAAAATEPQKTATLLNKADAVVAEDAYVLPLYQKPTFIAVYDKFANVRDNPTNIGPPYNVEEWGIRASAG